MTQWKSMAEHVRIERLEPPTRRPVRAVLDTDTYNEVDDQFALAYALRSSDACTLEAVYAAPFTNNRSTGPGDGMERSYEEILRVMARLSIESGDSVYKGSTRYLPAADTPVESPAARNLVERARSGADPLYVLTIGTPTNVASALLMDPGIVEHVVVVWLGGQPYDWHTAVEFNLMQDPHASRILFDSGVPLVHIPCTNVAEHLRTTIPELDACLRGRGPLGDYLCDIVAGYHEDHFAWSKVIWDIATVAWLVNPGWVATRLAHSPVLTDGLTYSRDDRRHLVREAYRVDRDAIFRDVFRKLAVS